MRAGRKKGEPRRPWKTTEIRVLKRDYGRIHTKDLAIKLNRTPQAVMAMAFKLDLTTDNGQEIRKKHSRPHVKALIRQGYSAGDIAKVLGTNPRHIRWMAHKEFDETTIQILLDNGKRRGRPPVPDERYS